MEVEHAVTLITGGASGIGRGVAEAIVKRGGRVVVLDLPSAAAGEAVAELGELARLVTADVRDPAQVERAVAEAHAHFGRLDALVSCAGILRGERILGRAGALHSLDNFRSHIEVNLVGAFDVIRHAVRFMADNEPSAEGERGVIVNVGSIAAFEGQVGQVAYSASKGGIVAMTLPLARELGPIGVRAVCICPGVIDTPMLESMPAEARSRLIATNAFPRRLGHAHDVGQMVLSVFENVFLNGEVVRLDAGTRLGPR